jgi:glycine hydroxymethyltransferase
LKGELKMMSAVLDGGVFPGMQGGPLEHVIAAKAIAFGEILNPSFETYGRNVMANATKLADALMARGYNLVSGGTDNHCFLMDLRNKGITGKEAELALVTADITVNKNMVPFDDKSPFVTSGIRIGTPAITTRGLGVGDMEWIADVIDRALMNRADASVLKQIQKEINVKMEPMPLFAS